jgi:hypothetical protein
VAATTTTRDAATAAAAAALLLLLLLLPVVAPSISTKSCMLGHAAVGPKKRERFLRVLQRSKAQLEGFASYLRQEPLGGVTVCVAAAPRRNRVDLVEENDGRRRRARALEHLYRSSQVKNTPPKPWTP